MISCTHTQTDNARDLQFVEHILALKYLWALLDTQRTKNITLCLCSGKLIKLQSSRNSVNFLVRLWLFLVWEETQGGNSPRFPAGLGGGRGYSAVLCVCSSLPANPGPSPS